MLFAVSTIIGNVVKGRRITSTKKAKITCSMELVFKNIYI